MVHFAHHATLGVMKTSDASFRLRREGNPIPALVNVHPIEFAFCLAGPCHVDELAKMKGQASVCPALKYSGIRHLRGLKKALLDDWR